MPVDQGVIDAALKLVEEDIVAGFDGVFDAAGVPAFFFELDGSTLTDTDLIAPSDASVVPVPWRFHCTHRGRFLGVPATFVELDLRGATFVHAVGATERDWVLFRYVDYLGALHQMGAGTVTRPALTPDQYANWLANRTP
jgi:hypothetical protein